jgi:hypoxanthine phosphoribosyltransferase
MGDLRVSWGEYHRLVERLAVRIDDSGWSFDAIVCLARGGLRVGDVLSRVFQRPLGVLSSARPLPGSRWLLADDLVDSGETLLQVPPLLLARNPQLTELRTAVIWRKGCSAAVPDYWVESLPTNPWIHQPFEEYEQLRPADLRARLG